MKRVPDFSNKTSKTQMNRASVTKSDKKREKNHSRKSSGSSNLMDDYSINKEN